VMTSGIPLRITGRDAVRMKLLVVLIQGAGRESCTGRQPRMGVGQPAAPSALPTTARPSMGRPSHRLSNVQPVALAIRPKSLRIYAVGLGLTARQGHPHLDCGEKRDAPEIGGVPPCSACIDQLPSLTPPIGRRRRVAVSVIGGSLRACWVPLCPPEASFHHV
jgi:hypothetical protein